MSSKRALRRQQCGHKIAYATEEAAWAEARRLRRTSSHLVANTWNMIAYKCGHCGNFHVGHEQNEDRPQRRKDFEA